MLKTCLSIFAVVWLTLLLGGDDASPDAESVVQVVKLHQLDSTYQFIDRELDFLYVAYYLPQEGVYVQKHTWPRGILSPVGLPIESRYWLPYDNLFEMGIDIRAVCADEVFPPFEPGGINHFYINLEADQIHWVDGEGTREAYTMFFRELIKRGTRVDSIPDEVMQNRFVTESHDFVDED